MDVSNTATHNAVARPNNYGHALENGVREIVDNRLRHPVSGLRMRVATAAMNR